jgi:glycosyltransferase involved in cell wall biosynthesis
MSALRYLSRRFAVKKVWTNHSSRFLRKADSFFWRQKMRILGRVFDGLLAPSAELLARSSFLGLAPGKAQYVTNGVDIEKFDVADKTKARRQLGLPEDRFILLSTRRFSPKNGIRYLAMAMPAIVSEIPGALCVFCGNLPEAKDWPVVQQIVKNNRLEDCTRFEGAIPNTDINRYLNAADLVVLPSLMEATSISGLEAMSAGKPLVGTRVGGIPELIEDGLTGFLVEPGDPAALAAGVGRAYRELDFAEAGRRARTKVENEYTWVKLAGKVADFYQRI